jgi:transcriptional regulator with PAS, ATPase and Fis domain
LIGLVSQQDSFCNPINSQHLREDVYYRLNVFQVQLPALREHKQDIPAIAQALIADLNEKHKYRVTDLDPAVIERLESYHWPGNVRELRNVVERALILAGGLRRFRHALRVVLEFQNRFAGHRLVAAPRRLKLPMQSCIASRTYESIARRPFREDETLRDAEWPRPPNTMA